MKTTRRFKTIYLAITALFVLAAFGFAAAGIWVVALAAFAMGGVMSVASRQMHAPPSDPRPVAVDDDSAT